jgi:hypothetical protein
MPKKCRPDEFDCGGDSTKPESGAAELANVLNEELGVAHKDWIDGSLVLSLADEIICK